MKTILFSALVISLSSLQAQQFYRTELSAPMADDSSRNIAEEKKSWVEIPGKRTLNSSTYQKPDGSIVIEQCVRPINYVKNGKLEPISAALQTQGDNWSADQQPYPLSVNNLGGFNLTSSHGEKMYLLPDMADGKYAHAEEIYASENSVLFKNVIPGIDKQIDVRENGARYSYIIPQRMNLMPGRTRFDDDLSISPSSHLETYPSEGYWETEGGDSMWFGKIHIINAEGKEDGCIHPALGFDAAGALLKCGIRFFHVVDGRWNITIFASSDWINDPARVYPVVIDPLVTGPLAAWSGGFIPSCDMPNYSQDSILVTIPGQITVTALLVTGSFYADPFSIAVMADGAMYYSTNCNQTQNFTVAPPNGNLPGTAYLLAFNMASPLTCCYPQNCQQQQFWLSMHIGRTVGGPGCNTNYIYYDPNTQYPFTAYIEGHTVEYMAVGWNCPNVALCADSCTITGTAYIRYGVPPYIISHPWMIGNDTVGAAIGCSTGSQIHAMSLTIPNCPVLCDTQTVLVVPPPYVVDQCGNVVIGLPTDNVPRKPVPVITSAPSPQTVCSDQQYTVFNASCKPNTTITWTNFDTTGTGDISGVYTNNASTDTTINYSVWGVLNGCYSDTIQVAVTIDPDPNAAFTYSSPAVAGMPVPITDQSTTGASSVSNWIYTTSNGDTAYGQNPSFTFASPGIYTICQWISTGNGCTDTTCQTIEVIPAEVHAPNVITPNGDGINDLLVFEFLEFYPNNNLTVYNRWGNKIYEKASYANDWDAREFSDGTYYYVLSIQGKDEALRGFFELIQ